MIVLAFLSDLHVVRQILVHLGLPQELPVLAPARCDWHEPAFFPDFEPDPPFLGDDSPSSSQGWNVRAPP